MCDCIEEVQKKLTDMMVEKNQGCEVVKTVRFQNISWIFGEPKTLEILNNPVLGKYSIKGKTRKWEISMLPLFCPFCGKKIQEEDAV
jgi:hypothetical protein